MKTMLLTIIAVVTLCRAVEFWLACRARRRRDGAMARLQADQQWYILSPEEEDLALAKLRKNQVLTHDELWLGWESMFLHNLERKPDETER